MSIEQAKNRILEQVDLSELIGERVSLQKRSGRPVGKCPFHDDSSPSFTIFDDHYYCFGCKAHGDAINFVQKDQGLGFIEALKYLAEKFRIPVPELEQGYKQNDDRQKLNRVYQILQKSQQYFVANLWQSQGQFCRDYLHKRGFSDEAIKDFGLGFAPDLSQGLTSFLLKSGFHLSDCVAASVGTLSERDRRTYDFYRNRLMIPIHDHHGRIIAFGGRSLSNDPAKYKNSRESLVFDKSHVLYGLNEAKDSIRKKKRAIVTEGYMDALQMRIFGFTETVACLGTALTSAHAKRLRQLCACVYLVFDGDEAGKRASLKSIDLAMSFPELEFRVIRLPEKDDPDSFLREYGPEALEELISKADDLLEFAIKTKVGDASVTAVPEIVRQEFLPWLKSLTDPIRRSYLLSQIAKLTGISRKDLEMLLGSSTSHKAKKEEQPEVAIHPSLAIVERPPTKLEEAIIGHLYHAHPEELELSSIEEDLKRLLKADSIWYGLCMELIASLKRSNIPVAQPLGNWNASYSDYVVQTIERIKRRTDAFTTDQRMVKLTGIIQELRKRSAESTLNQLKKQMSQSDPQLVRQLLLEAQELLREKK